MTLFSRRGLQGQLADALGRQIVSGKLHEGQVLDVDGLEVEYSISRTVVREAIKVLTAKGLLDARPRIGTYVLPRASWNLLDSDVMVWRSADGLSSELLAELDELRRIIEPAAARIAAEKRTDADLTSLQAALDRMSVAYEEHKSTHVSSLAEHVHADIAFHTALLKATGNELVAHMDIMLEPILAFRDTLIPEGEQSEQFLDAHAAVFRAAQARAPMSAEDAMLKLLDAAAGDVSALLSQRMLE